MQAGFKVRIVRNQEDSFSYFNANLCKIQYRPIQHRYHNYLSQLTSKPAHDFQTTGKKQAVPLKYYHLCKFNTK